MSAFFEFLQWSLSGGFFRFVGVVILLSVIFTPAAAVLGALSDRVRR